MLRLSDVLDLRMMLALAGGLVSCSPDQAARDESASVHRTLATFVRRGAGVEAPIDSVVAGDWTALYVFGPYTTAAVAARCVGRSVELRGVDVQDDANLIVLVHDAEPRSLRIPRATVDFAPEALRYRYVRGDRWRVRQPPAGTWGNLVPASEPTKRCR